MSRMADIGVTRIAGGLLAIGIAGLGGLPASAGTPPIANAAGCPTTALKIPSAPAPNGLPRFVMSSSVAPSDTSTSVIIHPDVRQQITCGKIGVSAFNNIVFSRPKRIGGAARDLAMDILAPKTPGKKPLIVYITGGGFVVAPKESALDLRTYVAEAGFVVASIQYRTVMDGATYRDGVADVKSAIRFLRSRAEQYYVDPSRVGVWGESAGGYLAAMVGVTGNTRSFDIGDNLEESSAVQAVVDKFGPTDVSKVAADFDDEAKRAYASPGPASQYVNGFVPASGALKDPASNPLIYVAASDPPFLIFHGSQDRLVSPSQTLMLHDALRAAGAKSTRYVLDGAGHGDLTLLGDKQSGLAWSSKQTMDIVVDFLRNAMGS